MGLSHSSIMPRVMFWVVFGCAIGLAVGADNCSQYEAECCDRRTDCAEKVGAFSGLCYNNDYNVFDWDAEPWAGWKPDGACCFSCEKAQKGETGDPSCMFGNREKYCESKTSADCSDEKVKYDCCEVCGYLAP